MSRSVQPVGDYTTTFLVISFLNMAWMLTVILVLWGLPTVLVLAVVANAAINRLDPAVSRPRR